MSQPQHCVDDLVLLRRLQHLRQRLLQPLQDVPVSPALELICNQLNLRAAGLYDGQHAQDVGQLEEALSASHLITLLGSCVRLQA